VRISEEQVVGVIDSWGVPLDRICLVAGTDGKQGSILLWRPTLGAKYTIIEDTAIDAACYVYLLHQGAREFATEREAQVLAQQERWAGWNK
jgi:hypothetical protein